MGKVTGVVGHHVACLVETATRSEPGRAAMPARPQSHGHVTCPAAPVRQPFLGSFFRSYAKKILYIDCKEANAAK